MAFQYQRNLKTKARKLRREQTPEEQKLWWQLRNRRLDNFKFRRQFPLGKFILDFYCPSRRLAIELDGGQHNEIAQGHADQQRTEYLYTQGVKELRFWNNQVRKNLEGVLEAIREELKTSPS
jgi:very-short-patch-repair endonuclease